MNVRFTLPFATSREVGQTYLNEQGVVVGVILSKTTDSIKVAVHGECAVKCNSIPDENFMVPLWYDSALNEFRAYTSTEDSQHKVAGYVKPRQIDSEGSIISNYDDSLHEFILLSL